VFDEQQGSNHIPAGKRTVFSEFLARWTGLWVTLLRVFGNFSDILSDRGDRAGLIRALMAQIAPWSKNLNFLISFVFQLYTFIKTQSTSRCIPKT
jgi:hypothetical protein